MRTQKELREFAEKMAYNPTKHEAIFEEKLLATGWPYAKQVVLGPYIADFIILDQSLVIEIDGDSHGVQKVYDQKREAFMARCGFRTHRIQNSDSYFFNMRELEKYPRVRIKKTLTRIREAIYFAYARKGMKPARTALGIIRGDIIELFSGREHPIMHGFVISKV